MVITEDSGIDSENEWISVKSKSKTNKQNIIKPSQCSKVCTYIKFIILIYDAYKLCREERKKNIHKPINIFFLSV